MSPQRVQLRRVKGYRKPAGAVVVARPTLWGNPFRVGDRIPDPYCWLPSYEHGIVRDRQEAVDLFGHYARITSGYSTLVRDRLAGLDLACWCPLVDNHGSPMPCHADILLALANRPGR